MKRLWKGCFGAVFAAFLLSSTYSYGQGAVMPYQEYEKKIRTSERVDPLTSELFGEQVSLYNGSTEFTQVDIDLPGNSALPVRLARRMKMQPRNAAESIGGFVDWETEIPYIHAVVDKSVGWTVQGGNPNARCSSGLPPRVSTIYFRLDEVWHGTFMHIPGEGDRELLKNDQAKIPAVADSHSYPWITRDYYRIRCASSTINGYAGESFIALSPDGKKYYFNHASHVAATNLGKGSEYPGESVERIHVYFRATRVEDRFGNYVDYAYNGNALTSITSNDGRSISITYAAAKISHATANGRNWSYEYRTPSVNAPEALLKVTNPDGSYWSFNSPGVIAPDTSGSFPFEEERPDCPEPFGEGGGAALMIRHPSGAIGQFGFALLRHRRDGSPATCDVRGPGYHSLVVSNFFDNYSLVSKQISGSGMATVAWAYDYETGSINVSQVPGTCFGCNTTKDIIVTDPDGTKNTYRYGVTYGINEGRLLRTETKDSSGVVQRVSTNTYIADATVASMPFADTFGHSYMTISDPMSNRIRPVVLSTIDQDSVTYSATMNGFDAFARVGNMLKSNTLGHNKTDITEYHDNLALWVISQPKKQYALNTGNMIVSETTYNALALPVLVKKFGKTQQSMTYNADGTLATVADGAGNTITLSNWKRGIPRTIQHPPTAEAPAGATESAVVEDNGWITSITDENGYTHGYGYDAIGRLASIVYPAGDSTVWLPKTFEFRALAATDWLPSGISVGQWRQHEGQGNKAKFTYYDAMWRPILVHEYDAANVGPTLRSTRMTYDASGHQSFQSYPASDLIPGNNGTHTFYDALDRTTKIEQDSEHGVLSTVTEYLAGLQVRVTNPRGYQTTTGFMAWDQPSYDLPLWSSQPEGKVVEIARHPQFGWPLQLKQRSANNSLQQVR